MPSWYTAALAGDCRAGQAAHAPGRAPLKTGLEAPAGRQHSQYVRQSHL